MPSEKPRRLGRGLEALLATRTPAVDGSGLSRGDTQRGALRQISVALIRPNPLQPRKEFAEDELAELEVSIRANGLLQPITVRSAVSGFELIAGERRLRAMQRIGWTEVPAIVKDIDDRTLLTLALVENLQRADLNPIEEAEGYQQLISQFSLTQQQIADAVGKDRSTIANALRLRSLPDSVREMVGSGKITIGHARALLALGDEPRMIELSRAIVDAGLSVREVERRVREAGRDSSRKQTLTPRGPVNRSADIARIEDELRRRLQTDVRMHLSAPDKGEVRVSFYSAEDLERVLDLVLGSTREVP
jgi:ParB family chromosome partitioning protein